VEVEEAEAPVPQGYQRGLDLPRIYLPRFQDQDQHDCGHTVALRSLIPALNERVRNRGPCNYYLGTFSFGTLMDGKQPLLPYGQTRMHCLQSILHLYLPY